MLGSGGGACCLLLQVGDGLLALRHLGQRGRQARARPGSLGRLGLALAVQGLRAPRGCAARTSMWSAV